MLIEIRDENVEELFEILCEIPYREANEFDWEPPTERPAGIDDILDQIIEKSEDDEDWTEDDYNYFVSLYEDCDYCTLEDKDCYHQFTIEVSDYISNVNFTETGMIYDKYTICKCDDCGETFERVERNIEWKRNSFLKYINSSTTHACSNNDYWSYTL